MSIHNQISKPSNYVCKINCYFTMELLVPNFFPMCLSLPIHNTLKRVISTELKARIHYYIPHNLCFQKVCNAAVKLQI